jgi:cytochrome oxidase Cu insertion factor (SCO1/SenC/PrrC family)
MLEAKRTFRFAVLGCVLLGAGSVLGAVVAPGTPGGATTPPAAAAESERDAGAREYFSDRELVDQDGNRLRFYSDVLKNRVVVINVIFTNCVSACPMVTQLLSVTREEIAPAVTDDIWFVSISVDPERDTPEALKAFAKRQGVDESRWLFLTGEKRDIDHILQKLRRYTPDLDAHSTQLLAGTTRGRHEWIPLPAGIKPGAIAAVLRSLAERHSG